MIMTSRIKGEVGAKPLIYEAIDSISNITDTLEKTLELEG